MFQKNRVVGFVVLGLLASVLPWGCSEEQPHVQIHSITGRVQKGNGQPFPGGVIEFRRVDGKLLNAFGEIQRDGRFSAGTVVASKRKAGLADGEYRLVVSTPMDRRQVSKHLEIGQHLVVAGSKDDVVVVADEPQRTTFDSTLSLDEMRKALVLKAAVVEWSMSTKDGLNYLSGLFSSDTTKPDKEGVRIVEKRGGGFVIEDWASVFTHRAPWPASLSAKSVLEVCRGK
jgi:hypothetical protein